MIIYIPGPPVAQSRPRFARTGNHVRTYDAAPAKDYKSWVRHCAVEAMVGVSIFRRDVPLALSVDIFLQRPKSKPKKVLHPVNKPDLDNLLKGIQDAMEGIVYEADQQIIQVSMSKRYGTPGVRVEIVEISDAATAMTAPETINQPHLPE